MENRYLPLSPWLIQFRFFGLIFGLLVAYSAALPMLAVGFTGTGILLSFILLGASLYFCVMLLYRGFCEELIISPEGIRYTTFGYKLLVGWSNVKRMGKIARNGLEGVYVSAQPDEIQAWIGGMPTTGKEFFIPLGMFSKKWQATVIGEQFKQYAPHLFENDSQ